MNAPALVRKELVRVLLAAALDACFDAENHCGTIGLEDLRRVRLKLSIAIATLDAGGRGSGGQRSAAPVDQVR